VFRVGLCRIQDPDFRELRHGEVRILGILGSWISTLRSSKKFATRKQRPSYTKDSSFE
jgi:hypothetical protein